MTEFLSTSANDEILNTFLNCMNMEFANNKSLIISLKCLLSLINSPTKVIIDKFSDFYYENNKNNSTFMRNFKKIKRVIINKCKHSKILCNYISLSIHKKIIYTYFKIVKTTKTKTNLFKLRISEVIFNTM